MSNIQVYAPLVDGGLYQYHQKGESCRLLATKILGDDLSPPPKKIIIEVETETGKTVRVVIPSDGSLCVVLVDDQRI